MALQGTLEGYWLLALALFQVFLGLYVLVGFPRRDWNPVIGALFVLNGFAAFSIAGLAMAADAASHAYWSLATVLFDAPTSFLILYFALTFPRPLLGARSPKPLALALGAYVALFSALLLTGQEPWVETRADGGQFPSSLANLVYAGSGAYLAYAVAVPVLAYHLVKLRDKPRVQGQVGLFLAALVLRTGFISPFHDVPGQLADPSFTLLQLLHRASVVGSVAWVALHLLRRDLPARREAAFVVGAFAAGVALGALDPWLQEALGTSQPPLNRVELFLVRPLLFAYGLTHYQILERPKAAARPLLGASVAALAMALVLASLGAGSLLVGAPTLSPGPVLVALLLVALAGMAGGVASERVLQALALEPAPRRERLEHYRYALELALVSDGPGGLDAEPLRRKAAALGLTGLEQRLVRAELLDGGGQGPGLSRRFLVERTLAETPWSEVVLATERATGARVVLKRLHAAARHDPEARRRIEREARVLGALRHPGIVEVREAVAAEDDVFLVLEHVEGGSLAELLRARGRLPAAEAVSLAAQLLEALEHAHARGVVHRDLKPANVLLTREGKVKLADFGIAAWRGAPGLTQATVGPAGGTPLFMAPEQARGEPAGPAADLFAAGVVLHLMLTGEPPVPGWRDLDDWALRQRVARGVARVDASVPAALAPVLRRALKARPGQRFPDAAAMRRALLEASAALKPAPAVGEGR